MKLSISALIAASSTLLATNAFAEVELAQLDPSQVTIKSLQSSGSGCPFGTVSSTIAP